MDDDVHKSTIITNTTNNADTIDIPDPVQSVKNDLEKEILATKVQSTNCYIHPKNKFKIVWDIYVTV